MLCREERREVEQALGGENEGAILVQRAGLLAVA